MTDLLPIFLNLSRRRVLLVGAGMVAAGKLHALVASGADVTVVAPSIYAAIAQAGVRIERRGFVSADLDGVWLVVAAATPEVNREVAHAAEARHIFVNAVDDPANASAFLGGVVRRDGVTVAISTNGEAPALAGLLREAFDAVLPADLDVWMDESRRQRQRWRRDVVPMPERRPLLLEALNDLYGGTKVPPFDSAEITGRTKVLPYERSDRSVVRRDFGPAEKASPAQIANVSIVGQDFSTAVRIPWTSGPEDSWM